MQDASHVQDVIEGPQRCERTSKRKQRNKVKDHDRDRVKGSNVEPGQMGLKQRFQSVGVNYDGVTELVNKNHDNRSLDHNTGTAVDVRQSGKRHHHGSETRRSTAQTTQELGENRGNSQPEVGDKRGNIQPEVGDKRGNSQPEVGDKRGNLQSEVGDKRGNLHSEVGDKRGNIQPEVGDKRGNSQPEVGDKRGNLQSEVGDKRGNLQSENMKGVDLGPGSDRRRRRRRAARACPGGRSKRPVGFRSRSSNSSLDKIRFRSGRRSTPELKRRSRKSTHNIEIDGPRVSQDHPSQLRESSDKVPVNDMPGRRRSRHRHSGAALPEQRMGDQVGGAGSHDNIRSRSKSKGKHTYILQRSRGTPQRLTLKQDEKTSQSQTMNRRVARSTRPRRKPLSSRPTRSVGTNTTGIADLPQRISVIVDNPTLDVGSQPPTSPHPDLPLCMKVSWVVFNIAVTSAPVVSSVYFLVLYPMLRREQPLFHASALDLNLHGINSLIVLLEVLISAFPVRLFHCVFPLAYGLSYVVFSAAYWGMDKQNNVLYPVILDWNQPGVAVGVVAVLVGVATPLFQLLWYGVYRLRILVYHRLYGHQPAYSPVRQTVVSDTHRKETQV